MLLKPQAGFYIRRLACFGKKSAELWGGRGRTFVFKPGVNILTGPNGSGKSTILKMLFPQPKDDGFNSRAIEAAIHLDGFRTRLTSTKGVMVRQFDFEMHNPRLAGPGMMELRDLQMWSVGQRLRRKSHGEATREIFEGLLGAEETKRCVVLLDEPEQALDFTNLQVLRELLLKKGRGRSAAQFIIATHSPLLVLEPTFNVIEMQEGYVMFMRKTLEELCRPQPKSA